MAVTIVLKITNTDGVIRNVSPSFVNISHENLEPATLEAKFLSSLDLYMTDDSTNPIRINSNVIYYRNGIKEFSGNIVSVSEAHIGAGGREVSIVAHDKLRQGQGTKASQNNEPNWELSTPTAESTSDISNADAKPIIIARLLRDPYNKPTISFIPYIDFTDWDASNAVWLPLGYTSAAWEGYPSSLLSNTTYNTLIDTGSYSCSLTPNGADMDVEIDITANNNIWYEIIEGERVLLDGTGLSDYAPYRVLANSKSAISNTLTFTLEACTFEPDNPFISPLNIKLDTASSGIAPGYYVLIDGELLSYDGYDPDASNIYSLQNIFRSPVVGTSAAYHTLYNNYDAAISGSNVLITNGDEYDITVSQNALFPPGAIVTFDADAYAVDYTVLTSSWNGITDTTTITVSPSAPVGLTTVRTRNRAIAIRPQKIAPGDFTFQGYADSTWNLVNEQQYSIDYENGIVNTLLASDILGSKITSSALTLSTDWRYKYNYYNELDIDALVVSDVIEDVVGESKTYGGWGLTYSEVEVTGIEDRITKVGSKEPQLTFEFLDSFLSELGLTGDETLIGYYWDSPSGKFTVKRIAQETVSNIYKQVLSLEKNSVIDEIFSGVVVNYELPVATNYSSIFFWGPNNITYENSVSTLNGVEPISYQFLVTEGNRDPWVSKAWTDDIANSYSEHSLRPQVFIADYSNTTGYALEYRLEPGVNAPEDTYTFFTWFDEPGFYSGGVCNTKNINHIKAVIDIRMRTSASTYTGEFSLDIEVVGFTGFTAPAIFPLSVTTIDEAPIPDMATQVSLPGMRYRLIGSTNTDGTKEVILEADNLNLDLAAVGIIYHACPLDAAEASLSNTFSRLKELVVEESTIRSEFVRITAQPSDGDSRTIYAPESYQRMVNTTYKIKEIDIGVATQGAAISLGRAALVQALVLEDSREFVIQLDYRDDIPELLSTIQILNSNENFSGVVLAKQYVFDGRTEAVSVVLRDFTAPIIR